MHPREVHQRQGRLHEVEAHHRCQDRHGFPSFEVEELGRVAEFWMGPVFFVCKGLARRKDLRQVFSSSLLHAFFLPGGQPPEFFCPSQLRIPEAAKVRGIRRLR